MAGQSEVILYDLPSKDPCGCWSMNPWKTRMILNYKKIPYETAWIEYPDIAPTFKDFGIQANKENTPYTIPAIKLGDKYIMDSKPISVALEEKYPEPSLHLDSPLLAQVEKMLGPMYNALRGVWMPKVPKNLLNPRSVEYFDRTREEMYGMPLADFERERGGEQAWSNVEPQLKAIANFVKANGGPYIMGNQVSYADFVVAGGLYFFQRVDQAVYDRVMKIDPALPELVKACEPWFKRGDH